MVPQCKSRTIISIILGFICSTILGEYSWDCATTDDGQTRIPSLDVNALGLQGTADSNNDILYIFQLPHLNDGCYGEVSAFHYCYRYHSINRFNWTLLILNNVDSDMKQFRVVEAFHIQNHPEDQTQEGRSTNILCDTMRTDGFDLPKRDFFFGVTASAQGNSASLLAFHDSDPLYMVDAILTPRADHPQLIKGSTIITHGQLILLGVRCLWFVINSTDHDIVHSDHDKTTSTSTLSEPDNCSHRCEIWIGIGVAIGVLVLVTVSIISAVVFGGVVAKRKREKAQQVQDKDEQYIPRRRPDNQLLLPGAQVEIAEVQDLPLVPVPYNNVPQQLAVVDEVGGREDVYQFGDGEIPELHD